MQSGRRERRGGRADGGSESERTIPAMGGGVGLRVVSFCERRPSCPSLHARVLPLRSLLSDCRVKNSVCSSFTPFRESAAARFGRSARSVRRFRSPIPPPRTSWPCCMMDALAVVFDAEGPRRGGHMAKSYSKWAGCALTFQTSGWPAHSGSGPRSNQLDLTYICSTRTEDEIASISSTSSKPRVLLLSLQS